MPLVLLAAGLAFTAVGSYGLIHGLLNSMMWQELLIPLLLAGAGLMFLVYYIKDQYQKCLEYAQLLHAQSGVITQGLGIVIGFAGFILFQFEPSASVGAYLIFAGLFTLSIGIGVLREAKSK